MDSQRVKKKYAKAVTEASDRLAEALKIFLPEDKKHSLLGDFALIRNWAERASRQADQEDR